MGALAWLGIPLLAAIGAGVWGGWANRTRRARSDGPELDGYARFREAMERPVQREPVRYATFDSVHLAEAVTPAQDTPPGPARHPDAPLGAAAPETAHT